MYCSGFSLGGNVLMFWTKSASRNRENLERLSLKKVICVNWLKNEVNATIFAFWIVFIPLI